VIRASASSLAMGVVVVGSRHLLPTPEPFLASLWGLGAGGATFIIATALIGPAELRSLPRMILRRA